MTNLARKLTNRTETTLDEATVIRVEGSAVFVRTDEAEFSAKRAKSCLVEPQAGDRVLVAFGQASRAFVLAILDGEEGAGSSIVVEGGLDLRVDGGRFNVSAIEGVEIASGKDVSFVSKTLSARAFEADVVVQKLSYVGAMLRAELDSLKTIATTCDSVFERVTQRVKRSFRFVEDSDNVKAGRIDYVSESALTMRSKNTVLAAEEIVKVDAEQIQLG